MNLEAWGDCDPAADQPMRECRICDGDGSFNLPSGKMSCQNCNGTGEVPAEYDPLPDDVI